jgi:hypothetical protein
MRWPAMTRLWIALAVLAAAGCAAMPRADSVRVGDAQDQVRQALGAPGAERRLASGELAWFYLTGPSGFETWRVVFDGAGKVAEYRQVLTMANFSWMREGASREQVLDRVGPPMQRMVFARSATETWTYRWLNGTFEMIGEPVFDAGTGEVKYVGIFRDPAFSSTPSSFR